MSTVQATCSEPVDIPVTPTRHASVRDRRATDADLEHWLKTEITTIYDDLEAHPDSAIPLADVKENIYRRRGKADATL